MFDMIPVIRASTLGPLITEIKRRGLDPAIIFSQLELPANTIKENLLLPAEKVYSIATMCAVLAKDPYFGAHVGDKFHPDDWPTMGKVWTEASSLNSFLNGLILNIPSNEGSSVKYNLSINASRSTFQIKRTFQPSVSVGQVSGFFTGLMLRFFKRALKEKCDCSKIIVQLSDPNSIPEYIIPADRLALGDNTEMLIVFPTEWLDIPVSSINSPSFTSKKVPTETLKIFKAIVKTLEFDPFPKLDSVANLLSIHPKALQRELRAQETSYSIVIDRERKKRALKMLQNDNYSIQQISKLLGYSAANNFIRTFKRWTGMTPAKYRRSMQK
jgi:AraC-like DNA-binding protein